MLSLESELEVLSKQLMSQRKLVTLASNGADRYQGLMDKGYISMDQLQQRQSELLGQQQVLQRLAREQTSLLQQLNERRNELAGLESRQGNQLSEMRRQISGGIQDLAESEAKRILRVTAPESGIATAVFAEVGQAVDGSRQLMSIVPVGVPLQAELYAPSKAIGFISVNDSVRVRYQAYPYQKFGQYHGQVESISRTTLRASELAGITGSVPGLDDDGEQYYRLRVRLDDQHVRAYGHPQPLHSGMLLDADVLLDSRKLYEWVLEPLYSLTGKL
ncbi:Colicin V secretion protein CvaA [compost metagenome]